MFEIPKFQEFPVSYSFEAVLGLPSYKVLSSGMQYSPSWQVCRKDKVHSKFPLPELAKLIFVIIL